MGKYIQGKDGKFAGSIGDGKTDIPTPDDRPRDITPAVDPDAAFPAYAGLYERMHAVVSPDDTHKWSVAEETPINPLQDECRSVRLGGQLCTRHAAAALNEAETRLNSYMDEEPYPSSHHQLRYEQELLNAKIDYATTAEGRQNLSWQADRLRHEGDNASSITEMKAAYRKAEELDSIIAAGKSRQAANDAIGRRATGIAQRLHLNNQVAYTFLEEHGFLDNTTHYGDVTPDNAAQALGELLALLPEDQRHHVINRYGFQTGVPDETDRAGENYATDLYLARNTDRMHTQPPVQPDPHGRFQTHTPEANAYLAEETQRTLHSTLEQLRLFGGSVTRDDVDALTDNITGAAHRAHPDAGCTDTEPRNHVAQVLTRAFRDAGYYNEY